MVKKTERVCIHCGEVVNGKEEICPHCGLSVGDNSNTDSTSIKNNKKSKISNKSEKETKLINFNDSKQILLIGISVLILAAVIIAIVFTKKTPTVIDNKIKGTNITKDELNKKFDMDIKEPVEAKDINYVVEDDNIAKLVYKKTVADGNVMNFVLRIASSTEDIENSIGLTDSKGADVEFAYTPIMMTVICEDGSEVQVESKVALDDQNQEMRYMRALWMDNDKYYSMVTDNLVTREDFLQEVNRVIIANHETFEDSGDDDLETSIETTAKMSDETSTESKAETNNETEPEAGEETK